MLLEELHLGCQNIEKEVLISNKMKKCCGYKWFILIVKLFSVMHIAENLSSTSIYNASFRTKSFLIIILVKSAFSSPFLLL